MIEFTIRGNPVSLKRHRTFSKGGKTWQVDPSKESKADLVAAVQQYAPERPLEGPISVSLRYYMKRPQSHFRTGKFAGKLKPSAPLLHTKAPDLDNLIKILDAFNGVFWIDDRQIYKIKASKYYSRTPRTVISITERKSLQTTYKSYWERNEPMEKAEGRIG